MKKTIINDRKKNETSTKKLDKKEIHTDKLAKLDRKSSRGMIYENEELRLRTININAEVEKGQYDIKRLRRENEQLRREIWALRDECDRLNKRFKTKIAEYEQSELNARCSGGSTSVSFLCNGLRYDAEHGICQSEDTENCELCKEIQKRNRKENYLQRSKSNVCKMPQDQERNLQMSSCLSNGKSLSKLNGINLDQPFDHLSVVSEEAQSNSDVCPNRKKDEISNKIKQPKSPALPIEKFTTEYMDTHSIPPLSYFENINNRQSDEISESPTQIENYSTQIFEWEQNLKSPFPAPKKKLILTTSTEPVTLPKKDTIAVRSSESIAAAKSFNNILSENNNSKSSYAGIHPCSTFLAQSRRPSIQVENTFRANKQSFGNNEPPDICVTNGLATTFREKADDSSNTPETPSTSLSSNLKEVSGYFKDQQYYIRNSEEDETQLRKFLQYNNNIIHGITSFFDYKSIDFEKDFFHINNVYSAKDEKYNILVQKQVKQKHIVVSKFLTLNNTLTGFNNVIFSKPIYVNATNRCNNILMTATTITKPLMMVSTFKSLRSTFNHNKVSLPSTTLIHNSPQYTKTLLFNNQIQYAREKFRNKLNTENLESLLNDIEMISEDICALRMQNNLLPDQCNLNTTDTQQFDNAAAREFENYDEKKKFRSEMNLLLSKNGTNTTFLPVSTDTDEQFNSIRSTSLDKEYERTLLQSMPDPMRLFPENHHYQSKYDIHNTQNQSSLASPTDLSDTISARTLQSPITDLLPILRHADCQTVSAEKNQTNEATPLLPNRSQLYATVQNKATKISSVRKKENKGIQMLPKNMEQTDTEFDLEGSRKQTAAQQMLATASSWSDIPTHHNTKELKLFSFSTPNSPRSPRRNSKNKNSNTNTQRPSLHSQNEACLQVDSYHICQQISSGDDSNVTCALQNKCERRHSDCQQSIKPSNGNGYCHLHRPHQHIHRTSLAKNNNIYTHGTRKDSNFDIEPTMSDRNSYSSPSRESSPCSNDVTRKISIASHKAGKIPWCGCWGNGCI